MASTTKLESSLEDLNARIREFDHEAIRLQDRADAAAEKRKAEGRSPLTDKDVFEEIGELYKKADTVKEAAQALRDRREKVLLNLNGLEDGGAGAKHQAKEIGRTPSVAFDAGQLEELRRAAGQGRSATVMALTTTDFPLATRIDYRVSEVWPSLLDLVRIAELIPTFETERGTVRLFRNSAAADQAAAVAEGANKPESTPTWESVDLTVRKLAHFAKVNDEVIADSDRWREVVGEEMIRGLVDEENEQLLSGDGVAPNLTGILNTSGIGSIDRDGTNSEPKVEAIHRGLTWVRVNSFSEPTAIVIHPEDLEDVRFEKDGDLNYILGSPTTSEPRSIWGVPVVVTTKITANTVLVGAFGNSRIYLREAASLSTNPFGGEAEWKANQTLVRAEERLAFGVVRAAGFADVNIA